MIWVLAAAALAAQQPRSILFVGNSFTFGAESDAMTYRKDSVSDLNGDGMGDFYGDEDFLAGFNHLFTSEASDSVWVHPKGDWIEW